VNPAQKKAFRTRYELNCRAEDREDYAAAVAASAESDGTYTTLEEIMQHINTKWIKGRKKQRGGKKK
jgi:hypothetical protein